MTRRGLLVGGSLSGVLAGALLSVVVIASWPTDDEVVSGDDAAEQFVAAWERSLEGSFYVASDFRRTTPAGDLEGAHELAQRPPDLVRRQFGGLDGRLGNHPIVCTTGPDDIVQCTRGAAELDPYDEYVAEQVARWDNYFDDEHPIYRVETTGDGCFDLRLSMLIPEPPYGERARFCFDEATGAPIYSEVRREEGSEVLEATEVRPVTDGDFALPG